MYLLGFLRFLIENNVVPEALLRRKSRLKLPDLLPRSINPGDVRQLLSVIGHIQDRALILILLRTGMRIGELLALKVNELDIRERNHKRLPVDFVKEVMMQPCTMITLG